MNTDVDFITILVALFVVVGLGSSVVYYFARYYFRTHDKDDEIAPDLRESKSASVEEFPEQNKLFSSSDEAAVSSLEKLVAEPQKEKVLVDEGTDDARISQDTSSLKDLPQQADVKPAQKAKKDLRQALANTRTGIFGRIKEALTSTAGMNPDDLEYLEEILYTSDLGPLTVQRLVEAVGERLPSSDKSDVEKVRSALKGEMMNIFESLESSESVKVLQFVEDHQRPVVIMVVGVNGAGKTTTIGKLAHHFSQEGLKTMIVAGDTFRAAAREQLSVWSERAQVEIFNPGNVSDPSAVAFDGCTSAKAKGLDVVIVDTAGRLHTQDNLMAELQKMKRVIKKVIPEAPQEIIIVLDANSGQNALIQAKMFHEALELTGAVLTKLDGTAKGGVAIGLACELRLPIKLIGVGEGVEDLRPFDSKEFVDSIL